MSSPTQRSKVLLVKEGYRVAITERWNPWAKIRQDLFGFIDMIAMKGSYMAPTIGASLFMPGEIIGVQTTTKKNMGARIKKIESNLDSMTWVTSGGKLEVHGWFKGVKKWECKRVEFKGGLWIPL